MSSLMHMLERLVGQRREKNRTNKASSSPSSISSSALELPSSSSPSSSSSSPSSSSNVLSVVLPPEIRSATPYDLPATSAIPTAAAVDEAGPGTLTIPETLLDQYTPSPLRLDCSICFEQVHISDMLELEACFHIFCRDCIKGHCQAKQAEGETAGTIGCPQVGCSGKLSQQELTLVLGASHFQVLDRRALEAAVNMDPTLHLCPTPDCPFVCSWAGPEDGPPRIRCPVCRRERCLACGAQPYHEGRACHIPSALSSPVPLSSSDGLTCPASPSPSSSSATPQSSSPSSSSSAPPSTSPSSSSPMSFLLNLFGSKPELTSQEQQEEREREIQRQEAATMAFIAKSSIKICPRCKNGVIKEVGCDKLKCRCGYRSCWRCGSENAQCDCTPASHGFSDNVTGYGDFSDLRSPVSPT